MGTSCSILLEWAGNAAVEAAAASGGATPHLRTSIDNLDFLHNIVRLIEQLPASHPQEAKAEWRRPLQWSSMLRPAHFSSAPAGIWNVIVPGAKLVVASVQTRADDQPLFTLEQIGPVSGENTVFVAKAWSFDILNQVIEIADDQKLREVLEILQANREVLATIFGVSGDPGKATLECFEIFNNEADLRKKEQYGRLYKLLLVLNDYDLKLMQTAVKSFQKYLSIQKVTEEFQMLQAFCGKDPRCALSSIDWESDYVFANGLKAPTWRQIYGELCYLEVQTAEREKLIISATRGGYFLNKGYSADVKGKMHLNYEAASETYPSLVHLLRAHSAHFAATIDKQDYLYQPTEASGEPKLPLFTPNWKGRWARRVKDSIITEYHDLSNQDDSDDDLDQQEEVTARKNDGKRAMAGKKKSLGLTSDDTGKHGSRGGKKKISDEKMRSGWSAASLKERAGGRLKRSSSYDEEDFTESEAEEEEDGQEKRQENAELPAEYYQIQKLVKYLRCGNQTATIIALCSLRDIGLTIENHQTAILDVGGMDTLVNLLDTDDPKCKIGALHILKDISQNVQIRRAIGDLDGMQPLVELLKDSDEDLKCLAAETISYCAKNARNRRAVRRYGGIRKLVRLLKAKPGSKEERVAISGALALASCSKSAKNRDAIQAAGSIPLLANLLESTNENLLIPVVSILQECASDENYRIAIRSSGMIKFLVENLASTNEELQTHCASAIFKCAEDDETRTLVRQYGGLVPLVNLLDNRANKELLKAATGAVWKCSQNLENVAAFNKLNTIKKLVGLLEGEPEDVLVNVAGALGASGKTTDGLQAIRESNGITPLVNLLRGTNQALLVNVTTAVGACALDSESMAIIDHLDGVRLMWSLLKSPNQDVQAAAAAGISPCIEHAKDAGNMVRQFVGGLELIVSLLKSEHAEVLASVCAAIANIAKDEENLAVITDHGVVPMLAKLTNTRNDKLRKHLAEAIARCCHWGNNRVAFGTAGAVAPLVKYLRSPDDQVHRSTARALHQLSMDPDNCITMHENGVVQLLLGMVGSSDPALQEAAAGTIGNIRR
ncbi:armadillo-type protein [Blyttiomyces helicus]|uniref:Armadillo-type protein n=1 Tax=Blyttiomyces helicus TaxID=388810 RepID=A0A4P9WN11_9FUNG|nr:armadillo-type protein [Blyttiomyces helicus]|eukprot:RKO94469.1 armadillo-type protein [Blyttiomyces helicus]